MAKILTITDTRIRSINFSRDDNNNISIGIEYNWMDENGVIPKISLQVDTQEAIPIASFPVAIRNAMIALNDYAHDRVNQLEGIT